MQHFPENCCHVPESSMKFSSSTKNEVRKFGEVRRSSSTQILICNPEYRRTGRRSRQNEAFIAKFGVDTADVNDSHVDLSSRFFFTVLGEAPPLSDHADKAEVSWDQNTPFLHFRESLFGGPPPPVSIRFRMLIRYSIYLSISPWGRTALPGILFSRPAFRLGTCQICFGIWKLWNTFFLFSSFSLYLPTNLKQKMTRWSLSSSGARNHCYTICHFKVQVTNSRGLRMGIGAI